MKRLIIMHILFIIYNNVAQGELVEHVYIRRKDETRKMSWTFSVHWHMLTWKHG